MRAFSSYMQDNYDQLLTVFKRFEFLAKFQWEKKLEEKMELLEIIKDYRKKELEFQAYYDNLFDRDQNRLRINGILAEYDDALGIKSTVLKAGKADLENHNYFSGVNDPL